VLCSAKYPMSHGSVPGWDKKFLSPSSACRAAGIAKSVDSLMAGRSGVLTFVGARFSGPIQTRPKPTQPHGKWLPPVFSGVKRLGRGAYHPPPLLAPGSSTVTALLLFNSTLCAHDM